MLSNSVRKEVTVLFFLSYTVQQHFKLIQNYAVQIQNYAVQVQNYAVQQCKKGSNCVNFPFIHCSTAFLRRAICQLMLLSNSVRTDVIKIRKKSSKRKDKKLFMHQTTVLILETNLGWSKDCRIAWGKIRFFIFLAHIHDSGFAYYSHYGFIRTVVIFFSYS